MTIRISPSRFLTALAGVCLSVAVHAAAPSQAEATAVDLVVVVSPQNETARLSRNQVADLFLGRAVQFPDGRRAVPVDQTEGSAAREAFNTRILNRSSAQIRAHWAKIIFTGRGRPPRDVADGEQVKQLVVANPAVIGYIDRRLVDDSVTVVAVE